MAADSLTKAMPRPLFEYHCKVITGMGHPQIAGGRRRPTVGVFVMFWRWGVDGLNTRNRTPMRG
eukprot:2721497-Rhodomonas_salina.1